MSATVLHGDCLAVLRTLPDGAARCCVTSPPYFGLRDYGVPGQIGLEPTPARYVARMVEVFREVRRVLTDDGTLWLNLGDSYYSGDKGGFERSTTGKQATSRGTIKGLPCNRLPQEGLKPKDLVGIPWRVALALQQPYEVVAIKNATDRAWLAALLDGEGCITTTVAKPTTGLNESYAVVVQIRMSDRQCLDRVVAITGMSRVQDEALPPSMTGTGQRPVYCWKIAGENAATVLAEVYPYLHIKRGQAVAAWNLQRLKDGVVTKRGMPVPEANMEQRRALHRVIRALNQREPADVPSWCVDPSFTVEPGWYLRSDVIWAKPNPMPESVRDRPTKAHEYLFLLSKQERYFYNADAIAEPATFPDGPNSPESIASPHGQGFTRRAKSGNTERKVGADRGRPGSHLGGSIPWEGATRNARSVWTIATRPYPEAHFATFPEELARRCIVAGSAPGDTVLDPFGGSGTVAAVAIGNGRAAIHIDLNPAYNKMAHQRIGPAFCLTPSPRGEA